MPVISPIYNNVTGRLWPGFDEIEFLFIFGDSYSAVGAPKNPVPSKDVPLGVEYPGFTYNEPDEPNWVGCLVAHYHSMLVYDYAVGGHTIDPGVRSQVEQRFLPSAGKKPEWAPWAANNSLFITWVGVNDVAYKFRSNEEEFEEYQAKLFDLQHELYKAGARNFLFIDVPPMEHSPSYKLRLSYKQENLPFAKWNSALSKNVDKFVASHEDVTAFVFSAFDTFSRVFNNPAEFDFSETEVHKMGGPVWFDHLHPTSAMHAIIARELGTFLTSLSPPKPDTSGPPGTESPPSPMSQIIQTGKYWRGVPALEHLIIFGASYCAVGYDRTSPHPTAEEPLGVPFPGTTWAEPGKPNWVGHLVNKLQKHDTDILVYDFAVGGDTVLGVERQVEEEFMADLAEHPSWASWEASDSLVLVWVGINDCAQMKIDGVPSRLNKLFKAMDQVYDSGARNFLFIDIPPMNRSPGGRFMAESRKSKKNTFEEWNDVLPVFCQQFSERHTDAAVLVYSSNRLFTRVLDNPAQYGFGAEDATKQGGAIWYDRIHPASQMHEEIARDLLEFLASVAPESIP